jgi:proline dehydrogenase
VGLCIQAYLYRTKQDLERLIDAGAGLRLVKGAYLEPKALAYPAKRDVDENFFALAQVMIGERARARGVRAIFGTHDPVLIRRIEEAGASMGVPRSALEFQMLYGIQRGEQQRLAGSGCTFRVLVAYGDAWFAWYMRRLAERPANVTFVLRNMFSG